MPDPESRIRVAITENFNVDGIEVLMGMVYDHERIGVLRFIDGYSQLEQHDRLEHIERPTMVMTNEFARALLDALLRHYQGASDLHQLRQDFLHERDRVDKLLNTVSELASRPQSIQVHPVERS